jgi:hypothetical protein
VLYVFLGLAVAAYRRSLELNSGNDNAAERLECLKGNGSGEAVRVEESRVQTAQPHWP